MTDTTTTTDTLGLTPDTLTLVVVSPDYWREGDPRYSWTDTSEEGRTFYATTHMSTRPEENMATLITGPDDPRGGWSVDPYEDRVAALGITNQHHGWNVARRYLTPVTNLTEEQALEQAFPTPDPDRPLVVGDRVRISDTHPAGSPWSGATGTVQTIGGDFTTVTTDGGLRGGFDVKYLTRLEEGPQEATTGPQAADETTGGTFTQADVDRLVREAREAKDAELAQWKEYANGIAVQYAKDNDLCGNFERCMTDIGLMGRNEWDESHKVTRYVTFRVEVQATPDEDLYTTRYNAASWLADRYASTIVDYAVEVQDDDGDTIWDS